MPQSGSAQKFLVNGDSESEMGVGNGGSSNNQKRKRKGKIPRNCQESREKKTETLLNKMQFQN